MSTMCRQKKEYLQNSVYYIYLFLLIYHYNQLCYCRTFYVFIYFICIFLETTYSFYFTDVFLETTYSFYFTYVFLETTYFN